MVVLCVLYFIYLWFITTYFNKPKFYGAPKQVKQHQYCYHQPKPKWVKKKVIWLKALMPQAGCRTIAHTFNRLHQSKGMTVSKSYVNSVIRNHQYEIQVLKRKLKHKRPKAVPHNLIWGVDLTGKTDAVGKLHNIFGIIEHQSRSCLTLKPLVDKSSIALLECIIFAIKKYGKPKVIRTDNEAIFTSKLFRLGLWILGIKHQRTEVACPWQNGKVERFLGTLKQKLNQWEVPSFEALNHSLHLFGFWYNHVRPHDYLDGATPAEVWTNKKGNPCKAQYFEAWDGLLNGYYLPP